MFSVIFNDSNLIYTVPIYYYNDIFMRNVKIQLLFYCKRNIELKIEIYK